MGEEGGVLEAFALVGEEVVDEAVRKEDGDAVGEEAAPK